MTVVFRRWAALVAAAGAFASLATWSLAPAIVAAFGLALAMAWLRPVLDGVDELNAMVERLEPEDDTTHLVPPTVELQPLVRTLSTLSEQADEGRRQARSTARRVLRLLEAAPAGVLLVGASGRIEACSARFLDLVPARLDPVGRRPLEVFGLVEVHELVQAVRAGERPPERECATGETDLALEAAPVDGGVMIVARDVSRFRRAERARTDFVANVSHELRTPIAAIMGYSETLLEESHRIPEDLASMLVALHRNGRRLSRLFDDLLELYRVETRRRQLPLRSVPLRTLIASCIVAAQDRAAMKKQTFEVRCPDELVAWANPEALGAILANLGSNASKYTPEGGHIELEARREPGGVRIDVTDSGTGIPEAHHERIFERFYRVDEGRARAGGAGLGLAIVKHLSQAMGCKVTLSSKEGRGSTFSVWMPDPTEPTDDVHRTWDVTLHVEE